MGGVQSRLPTYIVCCAGGVGLSWWLWQRRCCHSPRSLVEHVDATNKQSNVKESPEREASFSFLLSLPCGPDIALGLSGLGIVCKSPHIMQTGFRALGMGPGGSIEDPTCAKEDRCLDMYFPKAFDTNVALALVGLDGVANEPMRINTCTSAWLPYACAHFGIVLINTSTGDVVYVGAENWERGVSKVSVIDGTKNNITMKASLRCGALDVVKKLKYYQDGFPKLHYVRVSTSCFSSMHKDCDDGYIQEREDILERLRQAYSSQRSKEYRKGSPFAKLPEKWKHDRLVAFTAMDLDTTGRVLRDIPEQDDEGKTLRGDRELVMKAICKAGTNLAYVNSESLRNNAEVALAAVAQTVKACKHIGGKLKKDKQFVKDMLRKLIKHRCAILQQSVIDCSTEPQRAKATKYCYAFASSWPSNPSAGYEFGDGTFQIPIGIGVGEAMQQRRVEIITSSAYAGQSGIMEGIDESVIHDPEVLKLIFEVDCVALLFNDLARKELARGSDNSPSSKPMRPEWKAIVDEWGTHYDIQPSFVERLFSWVDPSIWQSGDDTPIAVADSIHFWIECVRITNNPALLAEAPKDMLTNEEKMLEAVRKDVNLFNVMPWKLRVSETFKAKLQDAFPGFFLWITLEDRRAKIPSKARDSEMGEMIAAFAAVQKRTGKQQQQVPFLQLADVAAVPEGLRWTATAPL